MVSARPDKKMNHSIVHRPCQHHDESWKMSRSIPSSLQAAIIRERRRSSYFSIDRRLISLHCKFDDDTRPRRSSRPLTLRNVTSNAGSVAPCQERKNARIAHDNQVFMTSPSIFSKEAATASKDFPTSQRMWALPPSIAIHLSIGSVYVYSMWTPGMAKALGGCF
jgi:hypothetical protein